MLKLWILYASKKGGHRFPALALGNYLNSFFGERCYAKVINFLEFSRSAAFFDFLGRSGDLRLKSLWRFGYKNLRGKSNGFFITVYKGLIRQVMRSKKAYMMIAETAGWPDVIVSIQPEVNTAAGDIKKLFGVRYATIIIDLVLHNLWVNEDIDLYFAPNECVYTELKEKGIPDAKILLSGLPIRTGFSEVIKIKQEKIRMRLGLDKNKFFVLLMGGLLGQMIDFPLLVSELKRLKPELGIIVILGKNETLKKEIKKIAPDAYILGVVENMYEYMWASDVIISKPGSVTIAEVTSLGKPGIYITPKAGSLQETKFAELVIEKNAGLWVNSHKEVLTCVDKLMNDKEYYNLNPALRGFMLEVESN